MRLLYNSEHYYVTEFPGCAGIELVDKQNRRSAFLEGDLAARFLASMAELSAHHPDREALEELVSRYGALLTNPLIVH